MTKAIRVACEWLGKLIYSMSTREVYETNMQTNTLSGGLSGGTVEEAEIKTHMFALKLF